MNWIMNYLEKNRWYLTNSKLALFIENREEFKKKYIEESLTENESSKALILGSAFDDFLSYDKEFFDNKYSIEKKLLKADLENLLKEKWIEIPKWSKVDDLNKLCEDNWLFETDKIKLSTTEFKDIQNMVFECMNQELFDSNWEYEKQKEIMFEYRWEKIKWTLDRYIPWVIRDYKTCWQIDKLVKDMQYNTIHKYKFQLALYNYWLKQLTGESCDWVLDIIGSSYPYPYLCIKFNWSDLEKYFDNIVKPVLDEYIDWKENFFDTSEVDRLKTINSKYYNQLESRNQKEFYTINLM